MVQKIYLKIPVNRNGFQDPPKIQWSSSKESELWEVITTSKRNEIDWNKLSLKFQVPVTFLQQQAYWIYERQLEQLKSTIEKGTLSDESVKNERSEKTIIESQKTITGLFDKSINSNKLLDSENNETFALESSSSSSESSSDEENINHGSMLLQRSRILSKLPPKFKDLEEDDEEDDITKSQLFHEVKKEESSMSNFSCKCSIFVCY